MNKQIAALIAGSTFVVTTGLMFFICANAHIDFFPCKETVRDFTQTDPATGEARLVTREGTCSLMAHLNSGQFDPKEKAELTGAGWALLVSFCMGIGLVDSALLYTVLSKKAAKSA
ncbi:MAG: hypothetical protein R6X02_16265 [Enhygromyxa sp.]